MLSVADRVVDPSSVPDDDFTMIEICGYLGYNVSWLAPPGGKTVFNLAMCEPGRLKLCHRHPERDSILIFLSGDGAEFHLGRRERRSAEPGDVLFSVGGGIHGINNEQSTTQARWIYIEGPLPLPTEFPMSEVFPVARPGASAKALAALAEVSRHAKDAHVSSGSRRPVVGGGDMSEFGSDVFDPDVKDKVLYPMQDRIMRFGDVGERVQVAPGYSTRVCSPNFGITQLWVEAPELSGELALHQIPGADMAMVLIEGDVEFDWTPDANSAVTTTRLTTGMIAWSVNGEYWGMRNIGNQPAKFITVTGPVPLAGLTPTWLHTTTTTQPSHSPVG